MLCFQLGPAYALSARFLCALAALLFICAGGVRHAQSAPAAACSIDYVFQGIEHVNLVYDASGCALAGATPNACASTWRYSGIPPCRLRMKAL